MKRDFIPDFRNVEQAARNIVPQRMPLYEHIISFEMIENITNENLAPLMFSNNETDRVEGCKKYWDFFKNMGYDTASFEFCVCGALINGGALGNHKEGAIKTREDFEKYPWAEVEKRFFDINVPLIKAFTQTCPPNMRAVGGVGNGVFECVQDLVGYIDLCYIRSDDEDLYRDLFFKVGDMLKNIWSKFMDNYADAYCVMRFGDDLGFNTMALIPDDDIRQLVIPQYRKITDIVHSKNKPFLLHSCGNIFSVFPDIIKDAKIDAKHSNEDGIAHFSVWVDKFGDKIGNFGGVDTDILCSKSPDYIEKYVLDCLHKVDKKGGIAFGSGNSIPPYVKTEGYLAMVEAVRKYRKDYE